MKIKAYRVKGCELRKVENGGWVEDRFEMYTMNPKKIYRDGCIIVGEPFVEPVRAIVNITDDMLIDATFEPYISRKRKIEEETFTGVEENA